MRPQVRRFATLALLSLAFVSLSAQASKPAPKPEPVKVDPVVYVTKAGKAYHTKDCHMIAGHEVTEIKLSQVGKHTACKVCKPPVVGGDR